MLLTHFYWFDPHSICCTLLAIFNEIKFEILINQFILNEILSAGPLITFQIGVLEKSQTYKTKEKS